MDLKEKVLYHQLHPAKLATDIVSALAALALFWEGQFGAGLAIAIVPPIAASAALICLFDMEKQKASWAGKRMGRMSGLVQLLRLAGFAVSAIGAAYHDALWVVFGLAFVAACWAYVLRE